MNMPNSMAGSLPAEPASRAAALETFRRQEMAGLRTWFRPGLKVLELGAGVGLQARILADWGCIVSAIDIGKPEGVQNFPVQIYDGHHIPFADATFDIVFSSNVLEHVAHIDELLREVRRVLRPDGIGIHGMPTSTWRLWSSVTHYPFLVTYAFNLLRGRPVSGAPTPSQAMRSRGVMAALGRTLIPAPHGEFPNAVSELYYFNRLHWQRVFDRAGFSVDSLEPNRLFYTGYTILPGLPLEIRGAMRRVLGSSVQFFITRPRG